LGVSVEAKNGGSRSLSYLHWSWIRHVARDEGVTIPQSGSSTDSLTAVEAKDLASALRARAEKIRKGTALRDATSFVQQADKDWFPPDDGSIGAGTVRADFDDPEGMEDVAGFFELSGGVTLRY